MKITTKQLRRIIKEEISRCLLLSESKYDGIYQPAWVKDWGDYNKWRKQLKRKGKVYDEWQKQLNKRKKKESPYDRAYAKYDEIFERHSMVDASNALANDLTDDQYNQMDGYTQDLHWDDQLKWINKNHPDWLEALVDQHALKTSKDTK